MADSTVTWRGAVPMDQFYGNGGGRKDANQSDPHTASSKFDVRPFHGSNVESAMKGAVPYIGSED